MFFNCLAVNIELQDILWSKGDWEHIQKH